MCWCTEVILNLVNPPGYYRTPPDLIIMGLNFKMETYSFKKINLKTPCLFRFYIINRRGEIHEKVLYTSSYMNSLIFLLFSKFYGYILALFLHMLPFVSIINQGIFLGLFLPRKCHCTFCGFQSSDCWFLDNHSVMYAVSWKVFLFLMTFMIHFIKYL